MPPCGEMPLLTVADVVGLLVGWARSRREYLVGTNEAGMRLAGATRAADAAVWKRSDLTRQSRG